MLDIIMIAAEPWEHCTWRRRHYVAWNLAMKNRVLFVEPPLTLFNPFFDVNLSWKHLLNLGRLKHQGRNLYSYSPWRKYPLSLPFSNIFNYEKINRDSVIDGIGKAVKELGFRNPILWVYYRSYHYDYYGLFNEKIVVTDWYDRFTAPMGSEIPKSGLDKIKENTEKILRNADIVFCASEELSKDLAGVSKNVFVIPHGVDVDLFNTNNNTKKVRPKNIKGIKHPILGFLGLIHYKVDFNLLNYIAEQRPDWSILLMGREWLRDKTDIESYWKLRQRKNVYYTGELTKKDIPLYLNIVDVCLIPFKKIEFNQCITGPLKFWEYMASGKPIVAIDQGVEFDCDSYLYKSGSREGYLSMIDKAIREGDNAELRNERKRLAARNSWTNRVAKMLEIVERHMWGPR